MALYHTYRPQTFSEIKGQSALRTTLQNAVKHSKIAHAYLFTGPRGTGKTTTARILSKALNCTEKSDKPCGICDHCVAIRDGKSVDIVEIDAASHTGVDNIREIVSKLGYKSFEMAYKVVIIDEVHMLSKGAFNALLKTLEEPPKNVVFILATTEPHTLPETIISRCQRYDFSLFSKDELVEHLGTVAKSEKRKISKEALESIALLSRGAMRDALSLLDRAFSLEIKDIQVEDIQKNFSLSVSQNLFDFFEKYFKKDETIFAHISKMLDVRNSKQVIFDLLDFSKYLLFAMNGLNSLLDNSYFTTEEQRIILNLSREGNKNQVLNLVRELIALNSFDKGVVDGGMLLELAFLNAWSKEEVSVRPTDPVRETFSRPHISQKPISKASSSTSSKKLKASKPPKKSYGDSLDLMQKWKEILLACKPKNHSVEAFLRSGRPIEYNDSGDFVIGFKYSFHKDQMEKTVNRGILEESIEEVLGERVHVQFVLDTKSPPSRKQEIKPAPKPVSQINSSKSLPKTPDIVEKPVINIENTPQPTDEAMSDAKAVFGGEFIV